MLDIHYKNSDGNSADYPALFHYDGQCHPFFEHIFGDIFKENVILSWQGSALGILQI